MGEFGGKGGRHLHVSVRRTYPSLRLPPFRPPPNADRPRLTGFREQFGRPRGGLTSPLNSATWRDGGGVRASALGGRRSRTQLGIFWKERLPVGLSFSFSFWLDWIDAWAPILIFFSLTGLAGPLSPCLVRRHVAPGNEGDSGEARSRKPLMKRQTQAAKRFSRADRWALDVVPSVLSWGAFSKHDVTRREKKAQQAGMRSDRIMFNLLEQHSVLCQSTTKDFDCGTHSPVAWCQDHTPKVQSDYQSVRSRAANFQRQGLIINIWKDVRTCSVTRLIYHVRSFCIFLLLMRSIGWTNRVTECSSPFFFTLALKTASITLTTSTDMTDSYFLCLLLWRFTAVTVLSVFPACRSGSYWQIWHCDIQKNPAVWFRRYSAHTQLNWKVMIQNSTVRIQNSRQPACSRAISPESTKMTPVFSLFPPNKCHRLLIFEWEKEIKVFLQQKTKVTEGSFSRYDLC